MSSESIEIALVTPWDTGGGISNYSKRLHAALESAGLGVTIVPIRNPQSRNPFKFGEIVRRIPAGTDVVHVQFEAGVFGRLFVGGTCAPAFYWQLAQADWPVVTTLHEVHRDHPGDSTVEAKIVTTRDWLLERLILSISRATVVHTVEARAILRSRHGNSHCIKRMRHPVDEPVAPPADRECARKHLGVTADTVLLTFGWVEPKKRYQDVVRCLPALSDTEYLIAGEPRHDTDDEILEAVFSFADQLNVRDRVHHLGYVAEEDLPILFGATDLAIIPYNQVTQSGASNTALAYHCPVLTTSLPAFEELAAEYDCVRTYDDPEMLRKIVRDVTSDRMRDQLRESAKRYVEAETWSAFAKETTALYDAVVEEQSDPASQQQQ